MIIQLNGQPTEIPTDCSVARLIAQQHLGARRIAVEINGQIVPRSQFEQRQLAAQDRVEIVQAIGGG